MPNTTMFTPSQLLVASQTAALMAASGLGLQNPAFFHPGLFSAWANSAPSPPSPKGEEISPISGLSLMANSAKMRRHNHLNIANNNNNNVVSSSSMDDMKASKAPRRKAAKQRPVVSGNPEEEFPISPPASATSSDASPGPQITPIRDTTISKDLPRDKQFTCGVCNRSFGYKHVLQNHERTHTGEKPFECPECHKRFTRDHHLKTHLRLHTGERPYHCEFCDRQFVQVANLRRHLRVHTGERPYACHYCSARFSDSNQLKAHVLIHKGQKPFECGQCSGKFRRRHHLLHHKCNRGLNNKDVSSEKPGFQPSNPCSPSSDLSDHNSFLEDVPEIPKPSPNNLYLEKLDRLDIMDAPKLTPTLKNIKSIPQYLESTPRRLLHPSEPLITLPLHVSLPEQTEPEDLSMTTGLHSHSSGDSPLSRSLSTPERDHDEEYELEDAATLFFQRRTQIKKEM